MPEDMRLLRDLWSYIDPLSPIGAVHPSFEKTVAIKNAQEKARVLKDKVRLAEQYRTALERRAAPRGVRNFMKWI